MARPSLRRSLPPLNSLVAFEAAGRLESFTAAGRELSLTQAAISRQIQQLESDLGVLLFSRSRRGMRLTPEGDIPDVAGPDVDPESRQVVEHYYGVLDRLSAESRSLFVARHIEGLTLDDVAAVHGLSVSTAQRKLARARQRIAALAKG